MTTNEKKQLNYGTTQSNSDPRRYNGSNGVSHTYLSDNKVKVGNSVYYGYSAANNAKNKNS